MSDRELLEGIYEMLLVVLRDVNDDTRQLNINLAADALIEILNKGNTIWQK